MGTMVNIPRKIFSTQLTFSGLTEVTYATGNLFDMIVYFGLWYMVFIVATNRTKSNWCTKQNAVAIKNFSLLITNALSSVYTVGVGSFILSVDCVFIVKTDYYAKCMWAYNPCRKIISS